MLDKSFGLLFYLKKPKNYEKGTIPIYMRITVDGIPKELSTKRACDPGRWNSAAERSVGTREDSRALNAYLDTLQAKVYEAKRKMIESNQIVTASSIKDQMLTHPYLDFKAIPLDLAHINSILEASPTRPTSPLMIELLSGTYELHGNYTQLINPRQIEFINPDDRLFVLNQFYGSVYEAYIAKWDCVAPTSIDKKAKEINKMLSKALKQIPDEGEGIIHIGYETVNGPLVEFRRQEKINQVIDRFNFGSKNIKAVFFNSFTATAKIRRFRLGRNNIIF